MWQPWSDPLLFSSQETGGGLFLTGFAGETDTLCIPSEIGGQPVTGIASGAFSGLASRVIILHPSRREIGADAFHDAAVEELYLSDSSCFFCKYRYMIKLADEVDQVVFET